MNTLQIAGSMVLAFGLSNCAWSEFFETLYGQATIATPSTTGPVCTFLGSQDRSDGYDMMQLSCTNGRTVFVGWRVITVSEDDRGVAVLPPSLQPDPWVITSPEDGRGVGKSRNIRARVTPEIGQAGGNRETGTLALSIDTEIPRSLYQQAAEFDVRLAHQMCRVIDSYRLQQVQWEFRFSCDR